VLIDKEKLVDPRKQRVQKIERTLLQGTEDILQLIEVEGGANLAQSQISPKRQDKKKKKNEDENNAAAQTHHKLIRQSPNPPVFKYIPPKEIIQRLIRKGTLIKTIADLKL
jgi:hypothetical protein